jgi:hypothetical protein
MLLNDVICEIHVSLMYITNLLGFIGLYKFCVKFKFYMFIQKSYEFHVMFNMNNIQMDETLFLNDICECECLIH